MPFQAAHLLAFEDRDGWVPQDWPLAVEQERARLAFTMLVDGCPVACAGVARWGETWKAWVTLSEPALRYPVWVTRHIRWILADAMRALRLPCVEAVVLADNERNQRWIELLGFRRDLRYPDCVLEQGRALLRYEYLRSTETR